MFVFIEIPEALRIPRSKWLKALWQEQLKYLSLNVDHYETGHNMAQALRSQVIKK